MKKSGFSVPSVAEMREASKIRAENKPSIFRGPMDSRKGEVQVDGVSRDSSSKVSSSSVGEASSYQDTATQVSYHPHAIVANVIQVR